MKKYINFINEMHSTGENNISIPIDFMFAIDVRNSTLLEKNNVIVELKKYFKIEDSVINFLIPKEHQRPIWVIDIFKNTENKLKIHFNAINIGEYSYLVCDIITIKEFLTYGLTGIQNYIKIKKDLEKYNL